MITAIDYTRRGWSVVPIPYRSKSPQRPGWQQLRLAEADLPRFFGDGPCNIGVLLGEPSGWLVDVDLDHELTVALADQYLPPTEAIFGRVGKRRSHWLYRATRPVATQQWRLPDRAMVVELRSTGGQTVFPGSVHPSGEPIEWDADGDPASVDPDVLQPRLDRMYEEVCRRLGPPRPTELGSHASRSVPKAPPTVLQRARTYLAKLPPAVSGKGGHDATFHAACVLAIGFGLGREQTLLLLQEWNDICQPPWSDKELAHKVDDALRQPGWRGYLLSREPLRPRQSASVAIERANRRAIEHRRRAQRRARA